MPEILPSTARANWSTSISRTIGTAVNVSPRLVRGKVYNDDKRLVGPYLERWRWGNAWKRWQPPGHHRRRRCLSPPDALGMKATLPPTYPRRTLAQSTSRPQEPEQQHHWRLVHHQDDPEERKCWHWYYNAWIHYMLQETLFF
jgi:hypothetical protein